MRRSRRSLSKAAAEPEVVSLLDDDEPAGGGAGKVTSNGATAPPVSCVAAATAAAAVKSPVKPARKPASRKPAGPTAIEYDGEYAFPSEDEEEQQQQQQQQQQSNSSDSDWQQEEQPKQQPAKQLPKQRRQRKQQLQEDAAEDIVEVQGLISQAVSKRSSSSKRPAASTDTAALPTAAADGAAARQPPSKRAKSSSSSAAPAQKAAAGKAAASRGARAAVTAAAAAAGKGSKQTTLHSRGFGALCFSASQPAASGQAGSQQTGSQGTSTALQAAAASAVEAPSTAAVEAAAAAAADAASVQWVDKHQPASPEALLVHKRKVGEVQAWLQVYLEARKAGYCPTRALLVTGPTGCGKSVTLRVLAAAMGFELTEWNAPVPTLWQDYQYQAGAGVGYSSKLDEFDLFVTRCKFAALPLTCSSGSKPYQPSQQQSQGQGSQQTQQRVSQEQLSQELMPPPKRRLPQLFPLQQQSQQQQLSQQQQQTLPSQLPSLQTQQQQPSSQPSQASSQPQQRRQRQRSQARPKLLLVDDLPYVGDPTRRARLAASLGDLAATARCPVVVVATTEEGGSGGSKGGGYSSYGAAATGMTSKGLHKDMLAVLEAAGATYINFNPITANTITKALQDIAGSEGFVLEPDTADAIAQAAAGDLRNAIQSLQLMLLQQQPAPVQAGKRGKAKAPKRPRRTAVKDPAAAAAADAAKQQMAGQVARDQHLSVYHAVGKLLHYKRQQPGEQQQQGEGEKSQQHAAAGAGSSKAATQQEGRGHDSDVEIVDAAASQQEQVQVTHSRFWRAPLRINPEAIIQGSGLEALQVTSFLSENYPHFFAEDSIEQAAAAAAFLSDAGFMACHRSPVASSSAGFWDEDDAAATTLQASAASSTAARGLLFCNTQPAPSRWLPLKGPSCFLPERAAAGNLQRLAQAVQQLQDGLEQDGSVRQQAGLSLAGQLLHSGRQERAAQVLPYLQVLSRAHGRLWVQAVLPRSWCHVWNGTLNEGQGSGSGMQALPVCAALAAAVGSVLAAGGLGGSGAGVGAQQQRGLGAAGQIGVVDGSAGGSEEVDEIDEIEDD